MANATPMARELRQQMRVLEDHFVQIGRLMDLLSHSQQVLRKDCQLLYGNVEQVCTDLQAVRGELVFQNPTRQQAQPGMGEPVFPPPSMPPFVPVFVNNMGQTPPQTGPPHAGYAPGLATAPGHSPHPASAPSNGHAHGFVHPQTMSGSGQQMSGIPAYLPQLSLADQQYTLPPPAPSRPMTESPQQGVLSSQQYEAYYVMPKAKAMAATTGPAAAAAEPSPFTDVRPPPAAAAGAVGVPKMPPPGRLPPAAESTLQSLAKQMPTRPLGQPPVIDVYICGGDDDENQTQTGHFEPTTGAFSILPPMLNNHGRQCAAAASFGKLYIFGGQANGESVDCAERYDPTAGVWEELPRMPSPRVGCTAAAVAGNLYVCGGYDSYTQQHLNTADRWDPQTNQWEAIEHMPTARSMCTAAAAEINLYIFGGTDGENAALSACERFVPASGKWEELPKMQTPRRGCCAAASRGLLYVFGGSDGNDILRTGERLDPSQGRWTDLPPMSTPRIHFMMGAAAGSIYVFGGQDAASAHTKGERFEISRSLWSQLPTMAAAHNYCSGAVWSR